MKPLVSRDVTVSPGNVETQRRHIRPETIVREMTCQEKRSVISTMIGKIMKEGSYYLSENFYWKSEYSLANFNSIKNIKNNRKLLYSNQS